MTTYKLNAYRQILEILYVCIYHNMLKVLWIKYCLNQEMWHFIFNKPDKYETHACSFIFWH